MGTDNLSVEQKMAKLVIALRAIRPFYAAIYEVIEKVPDNSVATVGVSADKMVYSEEFIDNTMFDDLVFIMLHEMSHIALMHVSRMENREPRLWNVACDLYVNKLLADEFELAKPGEIVVVNGYNIRFPEDCLYASTIDLENDFIEKIYEDMLDKKSDKFRYKGSGSGDSSPNNASANIDLDLVEMDIRPSNEDSSKTLQDSHKVIADAKTRMSLKGYGDASCRLEIICNTMLKSKIDWKKLLKRYLINENIKDSSFSNPDKRMYYQNAIYPGSVDAGSDNKLRGVKICIDTSGSISDEDIMYFCGQVYSILKKYKMSAEMIYWDTVVQSVGEFENYKQFKRVDCYGGGGTDPECIFDYFDSKKEKPIVTLIFTDGYFDMSWVTPKVKRKYKDTIWIMTRNHNKGFREHFGKLCVPEFK